MDVISGESVTNLLAAVAIFVSLAALWSSVGANRSARTVYVTDVRREWEILHADWATGLLLFRGPDDYYVDAPLEQRDRVRKMISELDSMSDITLEVNLMREETKGVRRVARFLAYAGQLVLSGRISSEDIYAVLGPDVARHGKAIRWMCGAERVRPEESIGVGRADEYPAWILLADQITEWSYYGEQEIVLTLVDILWSEVARNGDNEPHSLLFVAEHKKESGSGRACRKRVWRLALRRGGLWQAFRLVRQLRFAEVLRFDAVFGGKREVIVPVDPSLIRGGFLGTSFLTRRRVEAAMIRKGS